MSDLALRGASLRGPRPLAPPWAALRVDPDPRRRLQLVLAAIWLFDGVLQYQSFMFTKAFGSQMLAPTAEGNPDLIAHPITWAARIVEHHPVGTNAAFATIQLLLGLGIAWRPTVRVALAASVVWALAVWWLGEGLGGVLTWSANPLTGAPGAAFIYVVLAVLLWPARDETTSTWFVAARPIGVTSARVGWLAFWGSLAWFALWGANRAPQAWRDAAHDAASGQPRWLGATNRAIARQLADHGAPASIVFSILLGFIAIGVFLPLPFTRAAVALALVLAMVIWVAFQGLGGLFGGDGTDPNSAPLLALLAATYWPRRPTGHQPQDDQAAS